MGMRERRSYISNPAAVVLSKPASIIQAPDRRLTTPCTPITSFDDSLTEFAEQLRVSCSTNNGCGLAANQIGGDKRIITISSFFGRLPFCCMINPEIIQTGKNQSWGEEGCLSIEFGKPRFRVSRWNTITVIFCDIQGRFWCQKLRGLEARVVQHEIDHLDGKLINA